MMLARFKGRSPELWQALTEFGTASGLFVDVEVRRLRKEDDPFQIVVKVQGQRRNLIDVGYGVSQILPVLVEVLAAPPGSIFLIQQPEVHLHPRAQAALATLFARIVRERGCQLVVETHSDHFIDRVRMDVRDGVGLRPDQVSLLYFEPGAVGATIHPLTLDDRGNITNTPIGYRRFFMEEERRFFGGE